ncbi:MAG: hypothetical protein M1832_002939 [Thelocarpon impressellum]|nr:MAG: hypothetical protein M1832_002939 [Thelocarpon impressellum]
MRSIHGLWAPLVPGLLLTIASANPSGYDGHSSLLSRDEPPRLVIARAPNVQSPGVGVELEYRNMALKSDQQEKASAAFNKVDSIKGKPMKLINKDRANGILSAHSKFWEFTAEHSGTEDGSAIAILIAEIIVNGQTVKVGGKNTESHPGTDPPSSSEGVATSMSLKEVGRSITDFINAMEPQVGLQVSIPGFDEFGPWTATSPSAFRGAGSTIWGKQVTAPLPLSIIQRCFVSKDKACPLLTSNPRALDKLHKVEQEHFRSFTEISTTDINEEFLGFFSLVTSYALAAKDGNRAVGPKQSLPIMPRTDFATIYKTNIQKKLQRQLDSDCDTLYGIVNKLANQVANRDLHGYTFKWPRGPSISKDTAPAKAPPLPPPLPSFPRPPGKNLLRARAKTGKNKDTTWSSQEEDTKKGELEVKTWLDEIENRQVDTLSALDEQIFDGSIGAFGSQLETSVDGTKLCPIFEFRDLEGVKGDNLEADFAMIDDYIVRMHNTRPVTPPLKSRDRRPSKLAPATLQGRRDDPCRCEKLRKKNKSKCQKQKCPQGQVSVLKGQLATCEPCGNGKKANAAGDKCEVECEKGKKPNDAGDKCEKDCPTGQKPNVAGDKCDVDCKKGQKEVAGKCVDETSDKEKEDEKKDKTKSDKEKEDEKKDKEKSDKEKEDEKKDKTKSDKEKEDEKKDKENSDKEKGDEKSNEAKEDKDKAKKKARVGACLAFLAAGVATETLNPDDMLEAAEEWPSDVDWVEGELTESNIELPPPKPSVSRRGILPGRGPGLIIPNLIGATKGGTKGGSKQGGGRANAPDPAPKTAPKGSEASKKTIDGFKGEKAFKACLVLSAATLVSASGATLHLDKKVPSEGFKPDEAEKKMYVKFCLGEDCYEVNGDDVQSAEYQSYADSFFRPDRLEVDKCTNVQKPMVDDKGSLVTAYFVEDACCTFYSARDCTAGLSMFSAENREHQALPEEANDKIMSFMCNHDSCKGHPSKDNACKTPACETSRRGGTVPFRA